MIGYPFFHESTAMGVGGVVIFLLALAVTVALWRARHRRARLMRSIPFTLLISGAIWATLFLAARLHPLLVYLLLFPYLWVLGQEMQRDQWVHLALLGGTGFLGFLLAQVPVFAIGATAIIWLVVVIYPVRTLLNPTRLPRVDEIELFVPPRGAIEYEDWPQKSK